MFSHFFIDRPIFACVVCLIIVLLGAVVIPTLPVEQLPDIVPPIVAVTAAYPGASAQDVIDAVAIPLEEALNGVDNMIYMSTSATSNGTLRIAVTFAVGTDPDIASVLVQNRVKSAEPLLPEEVRRQGIRVNKQGGEIVCVIALFEKIDENDDRIDQAPKPGDPRGGILGALNPDGTVRDTSKGTKSGQYLANYASIYLRDRLARVPGVGEVSMFDRRQFSMRIWLDEDVMAARGVSVLEVQAAIQEQNRQVAAGRVGLEPIPDGIQNNIAVVTLGRLQDVSQFENIILRTDSGGGALRLKDVALIELGAADYTSESRYNGRMATAVAIAPQAGANVLDISTRIIETMESLAPSLARSGLEYAIPFNTTDFVRATVKEFWETLALCVFFVVLVIFVFLQDWRAALIPIITIPVSIIGTFFIMWCFGYSLNTMSLFGLIVVIGIVVDNAIIVVENTQRVIDEEKLDPIAATKKSMIQVMSPVIASTLIILAVFFPTAMMEGVVGKLYQQFALTIAGAVGISGIAAVTLAPALCAILLRPSVPKEKRFIGFRIFNYFFEGFIVFYLNTVKTLIYIAPVILILWFVLCGALVWIYMVTPKGFLPNEDQGVIMMEVRLPEGATMARTAEVLDRVEKIIVKQQVTTYNDDYQNRGLLRKLYERFWDTRTTYIETGGVKSAVAINGFAFGSGMASNLGMIIMPLDTWDKRRVAGFSIPFLMTNRMDEGLRIPAIKERIERELNLIPEANFRMFEPPPIQIGMTNGVAYMLLDERGVDPTVLAQVRDDITLMAVDMNPIVHMHSPFDPNTPQIYLDIDRDKAKRMGVSLTEVYASLQAFLGSSYINDFNMLGRTFRVNIQSKGEYRDTIHSVLRMRVRNTNGEMVPIEAFTTMREVSGPQLLTRYNMFPSVSMIGILPPNRSTGEGIAKMEELSEMLPDGFAYEWTGLTLEEKRSENQMIIFFFVSFLFCFLILAAQYESWSSPLIIMMAVPLGIAGAFLAVWLFAMWGSFMPEINVYTQIGLLVMIGLSAKNAVLIVEFARTNREKGAGLVQAAYEAGRLRVRPIFMTAFAFILGMLPLIWADGAGSNARNAIGNGMFGGLLMETMVGIYVTPVLFVLVQGASEWFNKHMRAFLYESRKKADRIAALDEVNVRHGD